MTAPAEAQLLTALTRLITDWSTPRVQARFADEAAVKIDTADIQPLDILGMDGPQRASDLAATLRLTRPTMSKQLARMEASGLVVRTPDPRDGRAATVDLSAEGRRIHDALVARGRTFVTEATHDWSPEDRTQLAALMTRFVRAVGIPIPPTTL